MCLFYGLDTAGTVLLSHNHSVARCSLAAKHLHWPATGSLTSNHKSLSLAAAVDPSSTCADSSTRAGLPMSCQRPPIPLRPVIGSLTSNHKSSSLTAAVDPPSTCANSSTRAGLPLSWTGRQSFFGLQSALGDLQPQVIESRRGRRSFFDLRRQLNPNRIANVLPAAYKRIAHPACRLLDLNLL